MSNISCYFPPGKGQNPKLGKEVYQTARKCPYIIPLTLWSSDVSTSRHLVRTIIHVCQGLPYALGMQLHTYQSLNLSPSLSLLHKHNCYMHFPKLSKVTRHNQEQRVKSFLQAKPIPHLAVSKLTR